MPKTILYIATTIDGYIARPDGNIDWLTSFPPPESGDYGYAALLESIGTIVMGRRTYEDILGFGIEWPYTGFTTYVVTHNKEYTASTPQTFIINEDAVGALRSIKHTAEKDIWIVGGGALIQSLLNDRLIDAMIISVVPKIIGDGIRLFPAPSEESQWRLTHTQSFNTGIASLLYERQL
ncbi:MAG: dihydrofolate reductase family protein [Candidatus Kapaibacterium sp.]